MAEQPLPAYDGDEAFIFVTYAHEDADLVYPQIRWLQDQGFRVWWDEGISPGAVWRAEVADSIQRCALLLYLITPNSVLSGHCTREVNFALDEKHRPILAVHLVDTYLPDALSLSLSDRQAIFQYALSPSDYERKLATAVATYLNQPVPDVSSSTPIRRVRQRKLLSIGATTTLIIAVLAALSIWVISRVEDPPLRPPSQFAIDLPSGVNVDRSLIDPLKISRDGRQIAFIGRTNGGRQLYVRPLEVLEAEPISEITSDVFTFDLSPDGESVIFWDGNSIKKGQIGGGEAATIQEDVSGGLGLSWGRDDQVIFSEGSSFGSRLMITDVSGRTKEAITQPGEGEAHVLPHILEDGSAVLYSVVALASDIPWRVEALSLDTGEVKHLAEGVAPRVSSRGYLFFARGGAIWAAPFSSDRLELTGEPVVVLKDVAIGPIAAPIFDVAENGSMVYQRNEDTFTPMTLSWMDRDGHALPLDLEEGGRIEEPRISPDGHRVAMRRGGNKLWVLTLERNIFTKLSDDRVFSLLWHPSGERIAYTPVKEGTGNLFWRKADGSGSEERLTAGSRMHWASDWSRDGRVLLYTECDGAYRQACDIGRVLMLEEPVTELVLATDANEQHPSLAPDGRWLAYESDLSGRAEIYVRPYPDIDAGRWQVSNSGGKQPLWSANGDHIYYAVGPAQARRMISVAIDARNGIKTGDPTPVFEFRHEGYSELRSHDLHPDGSRFLMATYKATPRPERLVYALNWLDEVERMVTKKH